jgi:hypothetical protein
VDTYATSLLNSQLPLGPWLAALTWALLFLANRWVVRRVRTANDSQPFFAVADWSAVRRGLEPKHVLLQVLFAGLVFLCGLSLGGAAFVFFVGGLIVTITFVLALNVQGLLTARAITARSAATGSLTFSAPFAFRHMAHRLTGAAVASLGAGLAVAHLALLGGAFLLASAAAGCWRRARKEVQPK